jgi:superoxide dismutase, Cu-Zn family
MKRGIVLRTAVLIVMGVLVGCSARGNDAEHQPMMSAAGGKTAVAHVMPSKAATTQPFNNNVSGIVTFTEIGDGQAKVVAEITGLTPNSKHGFHIHEKGDLSAADLTSAGGHYNPDKHVHGAPATSPVHAGDLGNITADASGNARYEITVSNISIGGQTNDIVGRSVIIHASEDDLKSQPTGNSGGRIAGGVIELQR